MPRALPLFAFLLLARASSACMSYPELVAAEGEPTARDATTMPERPAQTIGLAGDGGADADADAAPVAGQDPPQASGDDAGQPEPEPEPEPRPCRECPPGTKCCEKKSNEGKGKGDGVAIVCKPPTAACSDDEEDDDD